MLTDWRGLIIPSAGSSADNLVAGFSLGSGGVPPLLMAVTVTTFSGLLHMAVAWAVWSGWV